AGTADVSPDPRRRARDAASHSRLAVPPLADPRRADIPDPAQTSPHRRADATPVQAMPPRLADFPSQPTAPPTSRPESESIPCPAPPLRRAIPALVNSRPSQAQPDFPRLSHPDASLPD